MLQSSNVYNAGFGSTLMLQFLPLNRGRLDLRLALFLAIVAAGAIAGFATGSGEDSATRLVLAGVGALIGAAISTYHYLHERFPETVSTSCSLEASCATLWIWEFHFLSIPGMAWVGFVLISTLLLIARSAERRDGPVRSDAVGAEDRMTATEPEEVPA